MRRNDREVTDPLEIKAIIDKADSMRLAFSDNGVPYIIALNFGFQEGTPAVFFFHSALEGRKLGLIERGGPVAFQLDVDHEMVWSDTGCGCSMRYASVAGLGSIAMIIDPDEKKAGLDILMRHYSERKEFNYDSSVLSKTAVFKLTVSEMTAKRKK